MKRLVSGIIKVSVTVGIFVAIFIEFGGGYAPVDTASLRAPGAFEQSNPAYPGLVGRLRAKITGRKLPPPRVAVSIDEVCQSERERAIFVRLSDGRYQRFRHFRHCRGGQLANVFVPDAAGAFKPVPIADAPATSYFRTQGVQLVPLELEELWQTIASVDMSKFIPWFLFACLIKLVGIFANVWRWDILLRGQRINMQFRFLTSTYFIGRYFGIVTPSTMGLDAWRLYETIRLTRKPVECTTAIAVERIIGMVGLLATILVFMPFAGRLTQGQSFGELVGAMTMPLAATAIFGVLILLQPSWFRGLVAALPGERVRKFVGNVVDSATAYSDRRGYLVLALLLAIFGQITTTLMYFGNAMALSSQNVHLTEVLFASAVMTFGTFVAPSASGEGVRELVFVWLIGAKTGYGKAFLIGHLGFWIEKLPLSIPGGLILLFRRDPTLRSVTRDDLDRIRAEAQQDAAG